MFVGEDHLLDEATQKPLPSQGELKTRRCLVIHFTEGASGLSSIEAMRERKVSAHLVVERDGKVWQCVPFNQKAAHAGVSRWRDPKTGLKYEGANNFALGIEIANAGAGSGALSWARKQPGFKSVITSHFLDGGNKREWECFYPVQLAKVLSIARVLVNRYNLDDVVGHDNIAPERKRDPGPVFPMSLLRQHCGFTGMPATHKP